MNFTYPWGDETHDFECFDTFGSRWICELILRGVTYPVIPSVEDVRVVLDIGANCGSATTYFARVYPDAEIHAFEPARAPYEMLGRNTDEFPNVHAHQFGLHAEDAEVPLYLGAEDSGTASIIPNAHTTEETETVSLRSAHQWLADSALGPIDVLKVDTEGCELPILESISDRLGEMKLIYLEFHSESDRRALDDLLAPTHSLFFGRMLRQTGELAYLAHDLVPEAGAPELAPLFANLVPG